MPYTLHIVTQLPQHKHLHEESNAKHYIEEKMAPQLRKIWEAAARGCKKTAPKMRQGSVMLVKGRNGTGYKLAL